MKFKINDKIRCINSSHCINQNLKEGEIYTINGIKAMAIGVEMISLNEINDCYSDFIEERFELVEKVSYIYDKPSRTINVIPIELFQKEIDYFAITKDVMGDI